MRERPRSTTQVEVMKAISTGRKLQLLVTYAAIGLVVIGLSRLFLIPWLREAHDRPEMVYRLGVAVWVLCAGLLPFAAWFGRTAARALEAQQWPPPGTEVWRDTPVVRGGKARAIAWGHALLALATVAIAVAFAAVPFVLERLLG